MSIRIEITGDTPQAIAESVISMAFLLAPKLREQSTAPAAEVVEPERKPRRGRKAETIIEHDEKEVAKDVHANTDGTGGAVDGPRAASATDDASCEVAPGTDDTGASGSAGEDATSETPAEMDAVADEPSMSIDDLRKFTINEYLNVVTDKLDERKNLYKALLDQFQVEAINALAPGQINAFKAAVEAKIAEAVKA